VTTDRRIKSSHTGGPGAGRAIARATAKDSRCCNSNSAATAPVIVLYDADLEVTADSLLDGMTKLNGQWCEVPGKVLAHYSIFEPMTR
jgi:betaine-aldehyde dehydrogenase